jgi:hypothetical protein
MPQLLNCKALNLPLCFPCDTPEYKSDRCFLQTLKHSISHLDVSGFLRDYNMSGKKHKLYMLKIAELYYPKLYADVNKLLILL